MAAARRRALPVDEEAIAQFDSFQSLVRSIRNARAEYKVEPAKKIGAEALVGGDLGGALQAEADALAFLARVDLGSLTFKEWAGGAAAASADDDDSAVRLVVGEELEARLPLSEMVDADKERQRLGKQKADLEASLAKITARMASPGFADKAPPKVVEKAKGELAEQTEKLNGVIAALAKLPPA